MSISVEFVDAVNHNMWEITLSTQDEIFVNESWYHEDVLLVNLSNQEPFTGRTTWSDLEMLHYQILLLTAFDKVVPDHPMDDISVRFREPFATFRFLATCIAKMAKIEGIDGFDKIEIVRPLDARIVVDFRKTFRFNWNAYVPPAPPPAKPVFQLVVDNTK